MLRKKIKVAQICEKDLAATIWAKVGVNFKRWGLHWHKIVWAFRTTFKAMFIEKKKKKEKKRENMKNETCFFTKNISTNRFYRLC